MTTSRRGATFCISEASYPQAWFRLDLVGNLWLDVLTRQRTDVSDGGTGVDREMAESVAGVARCGDEPRGWSGSGLIRRVRGSVRRLDHLCLALDRVERLHPVSLHTQRAKVLIIRANSATEMILTPPLVHSCQAAQLLN